MASLLNHFGSRKEAAGALAGTIAQQLRQALAAQDRAFLLVSGGRSPMPFFAALARHALRCIPSGRAAYRLNSTPTPI